MQRKQKNHKAILFFKKADWNKLRNILPHIPWHIAFENNDINKCWTMWKDLLLAAVDD